MQPQVSPFARKLTSFLSLSATEQNVLSDIHRRRRRFASGSDLVRQGDPNRAAYILASGWACSYILLPNGSRQIVDFQIPGDFLGLRSVMLSKSNHSVEPITPVEASEVTTNEIMGTFSKSPRLFKALFWAASRDESMLVEHLVSLGRRPAAVRTAHFLLELGARLGVVGLSDKTGYSCRLTQYHLADALGLTPIHINRVLRELREARMVTFQNSRVNFDNFDRLVDYAEFNGDYLDADYMDDAPPQRRSIAAAF